MTFPDLAGLPAHPLIVHATVVMVPLGALVVALHAFVPSLRARLGLLTPVLAAIALILVPLSTQSGETLESRVGSSVAVERHAELADGLLPWVCLLLVSAVLLVLRDRMRAVQDGTGRATPGWASGQRSAKAIAVATGPVVIVALTLVSTIGTTQQVVRIGHSGAEATWTDAGSGR